MEERTPGRGPPAAAGPRRGRRPGCRAAPAPPSGGAGAWRGAARGPPLARPAGHSPLPASPRRAPHGPSAAAAGGDEAEPRPPGRGGTGAGLQAVAAPPAPFTKNRAPRAEWAVALPVTPPEPRPPRPPRPGRWRAAARPARRAAQSAHGLGRRAAQIRPPPPRGRLRLAPPAASHRPVPRPQSSGDQRPPGAAPPRREPAGRGGEPP